MEHKVLQSVDFEKLKKKIQDHLDDGWELVPGSISSITNEVKTIVYIREVQRQRDTRKILHD